MSNVYTSACRPLVMTAAQKAVLMCIADYAHDDGKDWHSIAAIEEWTCLGRRTVLRSMEWLEAQRIIVVQRRAGTNNTTFLQLERIKELANQCRGGTSATVAPVPQRHLCHTDTGAPVAPPPVPQRHGGSATMAPEASVSIIEASGIHSKAAPCSSSAAAEDQAGEAPQAFELEPEQQPKAKQPALKKGAASLPCPHAAILALWGEVLPSHPQHKTEFWNGARSDQLRARWRETAAQKRWQTEAEGLDYFRRLFAFINERCPFLCGRVAPSPGRSKPFIADLAWLCKAENWAKTIEGRYDEDADRSTDPSKASLAEAGRHLAEQAARAPNPALARQARERFGLSRQQALEAQNAAVCARLKAEIEAKAAAEASVPDVAAAAEGAGGRS